MHELGIAESVLGIVAEEMRRNGLERVLKVRLEVGKLSGVDREALDFAFEALLPDSPAAGAQIEISVPALLLRCLSCSADYEALSADDLRCPRCGEARFEVRRGREMLVTAIEGT